jgi:hypothetical protein
MPRQLFGWIDLIGVRPEFPGFAIAGFKYLFQISEGKIFLLPDLDDRYPDKEPESPTIFFSFPHPQPPAFGPINHSKHLQLFSIESTAS